MALPIPTRLESKVLLMKLAGIDRVIVDWYGNDDYLDDGRGESEPAPTHPDFTARSNAICGLLRQIKQFRKRSQRENCLPAMQ